jgi:hypothetical protein
MSSAAREMPDVGTPFIILGADAVLAALPASPVQLAHACQALGFELAAPATWGDELIAERCLQQLAVYEHPTAVMCSCPLVTERLTRAGAMLEPFMLTFTSPPVATARYLRGAFAGQQLHITYVGACPGAVDSSIDARMQPAELLEAFAASGIVLGEQPKSFDALVPLDRRRFYSLPGGTPAGDHVERSAHRSLIELAGDDAVLELTQQLMERTPALLDLSVPLGCACAGAGEHALHGKPRAALLLQEPPRARQKVLDPSLRVDVTQTLSEACALHAAAAREPVEIEVAVAADATPVSEEAETPPHTPAGDDASPEPTIVQRRPAIFRSAASAPRYATGSGATVPRASLAMLRRALVRMTKRTAQRQLKPARARSVELREGSSRPASVTPHWLAIGAADLPRPFPPPPARHWPRATLEL